MQKPKILILAALACSMTSIASAAIVTNVDVNWDGGTGPKLKNQLGALLSAGTIADGDGFALQLGYFDAASSLNNFAGNFIVLAGLTSPNTQWSGFTVGDQEGGAGEFYANFVFEPGVAQRGTALPVSTTIPLSIRFFNAASIATATFYNTVSSDAWLWRAPGSNVPLPTSVVNIQNSNVLEYESISNFGQAPSSATMTTIPVPEPTSAFLVAVGAAGLMMRRRRQS